MHEDHHDGYVPESPPDPAENPAEASQALVMNPELPPEVAPEEEPVVERPAAAGFVAKLQPLWTGASEPIRRLSARLPLKTEVRVGLAAMVSFAILVTVLILNRGHGKTEEAKAPKVAASGKPGKKDGTKPGPAPRETKRPRTPAADADTPPVPTPVAQLPVKPRKETPKVEKPTLPPLPSSLDSPESEDEELVDMPPLPESAPETARTDVTMTIPPPETSEETPAPDAEEPEEPILPPTPTTMLEGPEPATEEIEPPPPASATENELPQPVASTAPDDEQEPREEPAPVVQEAAPVEKPAEVPVAEQSPEPPPSPVVQPTPVEREAPAILSGTTPVTPAPEAVEPSPAATPEPVAQSGQLVPLPLSRTPFSAGNVPARQPRDSESSPPVDVAPAVEAPRPKDDAIEPVTHVVQKGENFWTISRLYYGSGRFYKALWAANKDQVSAPDRLFVGTTIKVPPPERLDGSRIDPAGTEQASRPVPPKANAPRTREAADVIMMLPRGQSSASRAPVAVATPEKTYRYHVVKRHETLRSIARDLLDDPHRAEEIRDLNLDQIDGDTLEIGQRLRLPDDATVRR